MKNSVCKVKLKCGGCQYQGIQYSEQLKIKQNYVNSYLSKFCNVENIIAMQNPLHYRCKVHCAFGNDNNGIISGIYQQCSHKIVPIDNCMIDNEKADKIIISIRQLMKSFKLKAFDEKNRTGLIKDVLVRVGLFSNEIMVIIVTPSYQFSNKKDFIKELLKLHPDITTIVQNINSKQTSLVLGDKNIVIYGKGFIHDYCLDFSFRISPNSFYQINPFMMEKIYSKAIELITATGKETILDAYCGTGTIGLILSKHVFKVYGIELNYNAYNDAIINAKLNNRNNIEFINADASEFLLSNKIKQTIDVVVMDPPRSGSSKKFLNTILNISPNKIIYISCNPVTLSRDLSILSSKYTVVTAIPFDMFPFTEHVETVVQLCKK